MCFVDKSPLYKLAYFLIPVSFLIYYCRIQTGFLQPHRETINEAAVPQLFNLIAALILCQQEDRTSSSDLPRSRWTAGR